MPLTQYEKASLFRDQHLAKKLLLLPNICDALSAKLLAASGFPSIATASASIALTNGYPDGENVPFSRLLEIVRQINNAVDLPLTVDMERGFADNVPQLTKNIKLLIDAGAIGLNIEDGLGNGGRLRSIQEQCQRIEAVREAGIHFGVPLVINARTDIFIQPVAANQIEEAITRGKAYRAAGADCFYPLLVNNYQYLEQILAEVQMPVNVLLTKLFSDLRRIEIMGVARVSVGPTLLKLALTKIKDAAEGLLAYQTDEFFDRELLSPDLIERLT